MRAGRWRPPTSRNGQLIRPEEVSCNYRVHLPDRAGEQALHHARPAFQRAGPGNDDFYNQTGIGRIIRMDRGGKNREASRAACAIR
jgi:hypothetical protein